MKFSITNAFLSALTFGAVSGEIISLGDNNNLEDEEFWTSFASLNINSMAVSDAPSDGPSLISDAPSDGPSLISDVPSDGPSLISDAPSDGPSLISDAPSDGPSLIAFAPPSDTCESLAEVICTLPEFEILCGLLQTVEIIDVLNGEDQFTIFAPTNEAFEALSEELADAITSDSETLTNLLISHAVPGVIFSADLQCGGEVSMVSEKETTTVCIDDEVFQSGAGNTLDSLPKIVAPDGIACNGVIHAIDQVILPDI
jgi:uncharacterized surface protein with fasciclin (FAS1) repeats